MTLEEMDYHLNDSDFICYFYKFYKNATLIIKEPSKVYKKYTGYVIMRDDINSQKVIDEIQQAYNVLRKDLKELNK